MFFSSCNKQCSMDVVWSIGLSVYPPIGLSAYQLSNIAFICFLFFFYTKEIARCAPSGLGRVFYLRSCRKDRPHRKGCQLRKNARTKNRGESANRFGRGNLRVDNRLPLGPVLFRSSYTRPTFIFPPLFICFHLLIIA